ncbi:MAG: hypothetical protein JNK38_28745 [Acidobacteria bacterium]|nr:hypothetical protein [Acidobacteriota bacterium]
MKRKITWIASSLLLAALACSWLFVPHSQPASAQWRAKAYDLKEPQPASSWLVPPQSELQAKSKEKEIDADRPPCLESAGLSKEKRAAAAKAMLGCGDDGNCWRCKCCSNLKWPECCARCEKKK